MNGYMDWKPIEPEKQKAVERLTLGCGFFVLLGVLAVIAFCVWFIIAVANA